MPKLTGWMATLIATFVLAVASTFADLIWALWIPSHQAIFGLIHGALLFMVLGAVLGLLSARDQPNRSLSSSVLVAAGAELMAGLAAAAAFYALFGALGWTAMFVAWMGVWVLTAFINAAINGTSRTAAATFARGVAAAILSGVAFWSISGIWLGGSTRDPNYLVNFASWFVAFAPGFACLLLRHPGGSGSDSAP